MNSGPGIRRNSIYTEPQEQLQVVNEVLSGLQKHSMAGKWPKGEFVVSNVKSVGYHGDVWHPKDEKSLSTRQKLISNLDC